MEFTTVMEGAGDAAPTEAAAEPGAQLTQAQRLVIEALAAGQTVTDAAAVGGVGRGQVSEWRRTNPEFRARLHQREREMLDLAQRKLLAGLEGAAATMVSKGAEGNVRAAEWLLERVGRIPLLPALSEEAEDPAYHRERAEQRRQAREDRRRANRALDRLAGTAGDAINELAALDDEELRRQLRMSSNAAGRLLDQLLQAYPALLAALEARSRQTLTPAADSAEGPALAAPVGNTEGMGEEPGGPLG